VHDPEGQSKQINTVELYFFSKKLSVYGWINELRHALCKTQPDSPSVQYILDGWIDRSEQDLHGVHTDGQPKAR
jgi:hypothetical protein